MSNPPENKRPPSAHEDDRAPSKSARLGSWLRRKTAFDLREQWWRVLDALDENRRLRRTLYALGAALVLAGAASAWLYPWWNQRNALRIAQGWLDAGRLDHAADAAKAALEIAPENPESWRIASAVAQRLGNKAAAENYSRHAASLRPGDLPLALEWASAALLADNFDAAEEALAGPPAAVLAAAAPAQRVAGELARRRGRLTAARDHFEAALRMDGPAAIDEVPLGIILLRAADPAVRQRGLDLLAKWAATVEWGAPSLRALLADAIAHDDRPAMLRLADALRAHPRCTLGDIPDCLLALSRADEVRFADVLAILEKHHAVDPGNIGLLISWLNRIGRNREAVAWVKTLPPALTRKPPAAVAAAEALRMAADWSALLGWTREADWGGDLEPIRLSYELRAARETGPPALAEEIWKTLQTRAATDGQRALFTADTLYIWGLRDEAVALLWIVADRPNIAYNALGTLARHYQVEKDAFGQYRVFKRLHSLRADDPAIANNYAYFAALTGNDFTVVEKIARENFTAAPENLAYRSTYAFVLCTQNRAAEALALLQAAVSAKKAAPVIALPYGLALAATHQKAEAKAILAALPRDNLTPEEIAWIEKAATW